MRRAPTIRKTRRFDNKLLQEVNNLLSEAVNDHKYDIVDNYFKTYIEHITKTSNPKKNLQLMLMVTSSIVI